jgi:NADH-quinone oxidoreductase subunit H
MRETARRALIASTIFVGVIALALALWKIKLLIALLFFGGWNLPLIPGAIALLLKVVFFVFLFIWVRGTLPRLRYDMLMRFGWKVLLPLGLANVIVTSVLVVLLT